MAQRLLYCCLERATFVRAVLAEKSNKAIRLSLSYLSEQRQKES